MPPCLRSALRHGTLVLLTTTLPLLGSPRALARDMTPEDVARLQVVTDAEMAPDGRAVAYVLSVPRDPYADDDGPAWSELHVATAAGKSRPYVAGEVRVSAVHWTPDGSALVYLAKRNGDEHVAVWRIPLDGGESRKIVGFETDVSGYSIDPTGKRIAFLAEEKKPEKDEKREKKGFTAKVVEEGLRPVRVWIAELRDDGPVGRDDSHALPLEGSASELQFAPDGQTLALALAPTPLIDDNYMKRKIHVVGTDGAVRAQIDNPGKLGPVRWSPDGKRLAFLSGADLNDPGAGRLMVAPVTGGKPTNLMPDVQGDAAEFAWKDAQTLTYVFEQGTKTGLAEIGVTGTDPRMRVALGGPVLGSVTLSRDASAALVASSADHPAELYVLGPRDDAPVRWTDHNPWLGEVDLAPQETITWIARDGLRIEGVLIRPLHAEANQRVPLIHVVHGGPESHWHDGWLTSYSQPGQVAAGRGYAVLYANYRGSTGRGVAYSKLDQGDYAGDPSGKKGGEFLDLVDGIEYLVQQGLVNRDKVGVTGGSYGGFAAAWCATALTEHFAASVMFVGISDHVSKFGTTDIPNEMYESHARRWPWDYWDWFRERSPVYYTPQAHTPILILYGEEDTRVHPGQSMELYRYLKTLNRVPVRLVSYPGEGHGNRKASARYDYNLRMLRWLDHYLIGPGGDPPPYELDLDPQKLGLESDREGPGKEAP